MRFLIRWTFAVALLLSATGALAQGLDIPAPSGRLVTDLADMLSPAEEQALTQKLVAYDDTTSSQIAVVTVPDLGGAEGIDYAVELGRQWGVGQEGQDNGVVVLVSRDDRTITIAVGYGLEGAIPDAIADRIRRNIMVPLFRQSRFYEGISAGVDALIQAAAGEFEADSDSNPGPSDTGIDAATIFVLLIIAFFVFSALARHGGGGGGKGGRRKRYHRRTGMPPVIIWGGGGGGWGGGGGFGGGGGGGWGGFGGGSFGGGGASGSW